jgi:hypothetical protein
MLVSWYSPRTSCPLESLQRHLGQRVSADPAGQQRWASRRFSLLVTVNAES